MDTGSTHTFVHTDVARRLGLTVTPRPGLSVKVANGDRIPSVGVSLHTGVQIADKCFDIDCYSLPLAGFDVILSVHWLRSLGPILWNFQVLTMTF